MIEYLDGTLAGKNSTSAVIDCGGVGYFLMIPVSTYERLPAVGSRVKLFVHLVHREDTMELYGFSSPAERELFRQLISVSRVGPRVAIAILSGSEPDRLVEIIKSGDVRALAKIPRVGKKTAERIIMELREKLGAEPATEVITDDTTAEAIGALEALGFSRSEAVSAVAKAKKIAPDAPVDELIKLALKR